MIQRTTVCNGFDVKIRCTLFSIYRYKLASSFPTYATKQQNTVHGQCTIYVAAGISGYSIQLPALKHADP